MQTELEKEFIPYEEALALKQMGYDKPMSFGRWYGYTTDLPIELQIGLTKDTNAKFIAAKADRLCIAPTYAQAFRWFREKYNINSEVRLYQEYQKDNYAYTLVFTKNSTYLNEEGNKVGQIISRMYKDTYEDAELACLQKLIELCKQN